MGFAECPSIACIFKLFCGPGSHAGGALPGVELQCGDLPRGASVVAWLFPTTAVQTQYRPSICKSLITLVRLLFLPAQCMKLYIWYGVPIVLFACLMCSVAKDATHSEGVWVHRVLCWSGKLFPSGTYGWNPNSSLGH